MFTKKNQILVFVLSAVLLFCGLYFGARFDLATSLVVSVGTSLVTLLFRSREKEG
ncbi:MAG: hypothetical protein H3C36_14280 [Chitinophagaceae bacterium]|nr:hypothetical protein [Chitinophagaceae bacterium]MCZ2395272.1 hypothetical protein [Chitinophagales bacterium]